MSFKKYVGIVIVGSILALFMIAIFNYKVDPGNLFRADSYIQGIGDILLAGKNVAVKQNFDERLLQKYMILNNKENVEIVVIGSSRTIPISSDYFPGYVFHNYSVSGASVEDYIALLSLCERKGYNLKKVVFCLDPWLLNKNSQQNRWKSLFIEYNQGRQTLELDKVKNSNLDFTVEKYEQLISLPYLKASIKDIKRRNETNGGLAYYETTEQYLKDDVRVSDGSLIYNEKYRNVTNEDVKKTAMVFKDYSINNYKQLNPDHMEDFNKLVIYLQKKKIEIVFYLPPYYPNLYDLIEKEPKYKMCKESESYFNDYAHRHNIKIIGSYDPKRCGVDERDFLDGAHMRKASTDKFLKGNI